jgi:hypothetical protein
MSNGWLRRSLASLEVETRTWPKWRLEAASREPYVAIPAPQPRESNPQFPVRATVQGKHSGGPGDVLAASCMKR